MTRNDVVRLPAAVPGATVRLAGVVVASAAALLLIPITFWQVVAIVAALLGAALPRALTTWVAAACLPFGMLFTEADPARAAVAVLAVHLLHVLGSLGTAIPLRARVQLRALAPSASRFLVVQAIAQVLVAAVLISMPEVRGSGLAWAAPVGAAAVAVLAFALVSLVQRSPTERMTR